MTIALDALKIAALLHTTDAASVHMQVQAGICPVRFDATDWTAALMPMHLNT